MAIFLKQLYRHLLKSSLYDPVKAGNDDVVLYFVAGRTDEWPGGPFAPEVETGSYSQVAATRQNMLAGVKIRPTQIAFVVPRNTWSAGVVYTPYNADEHLTPFYVVNSTNDIYKCIANNNGARSTDEPVGLSTSGTIQTGDGYIWKYMSTLSTVDIAKFGSDEVIPVQQDIDVRAGTTKGSIDAVSVVSSGGNYTRYSTGIVVAQLNPKTLRVAELRDQGFGYYNGCSFTVVSGTGNGTITEITQSVANTSGNFLSLSSNVAVDTTSTFIVSPRLVISGDGRGAAGYVNIDDGKVSNVVVLNIGVGYSSANVQVVQGTDTPAVLKAHVSPSTGHGSDIIDELDCNSLAVTSEFSKDMDLFLPDDTTYYQFALIKDPKDVDGNKLTADVVTFVSRIATAPNTVYTVGERVTGSASTSHGVVMSSNSSVTVVQNVRGSFWIGEYLTGNVTTSNVLISNVHTSHFDRDSGELFYYSDVSAINRNDTVISEKIRCTITLEG